MGSNARAGWLVMLAMTLGCGGRVRPAPPRRPAPPVVVTQVDLDVARWIAALGNLDEQADALSALGRLGDPAARGAIASLLELWQR
ncbi:MAG: hypothetical protein H0T79_08980, partial [Deltaproteobacteria bacterium]|nr:hypothetical protein [Deltaproteobacteria bacterium]